MRHLTAIALVVLLNACANSEATLQSLQPSMEVDQNSRKLSNGVNWFTNSAESRASYEQAYRVATAAARHLSEGEPEYSWAVIMDIDETTLNNSEFQVSIDGKEFEPSAWKTWVSRHKAVAMPGVKAFIDAVKDEMHGRVVFVTNRKQSECADTKINLDYQKLRYDEILCTKDDSDKDKNTRFKEVQKGDDRTGRPPLKALMFIGDNIKDFPGLTQESRDFTHFGVDYFILPNPIYGSWQEPPKEKSK